MLLQAFPAQYTAVVSSEKAQVEVINEFQLLKRMEQLPESHSELIKLMQGKARIVQGLMEAQPTWSLVDAEQYANFYVECF